MNFSEYLQTADLWVTTGGNDLTTNTFDAPGAAGAIAHLPQVASVRSYQGGFLDVSSRRLWIIGRPPADRPLIPASQLLDGSPARAGRLLGRDGMGSRLRRLCRRSAICMSARASRCPRRRAPRDWAWRRSSRTSAGPPGRSSSAAATTAATGPASPKPRSRSTSRRASRRRRAGRAVAAAIGPWPGLGVQTLAQRETQYAADSRQGLHALSEIATLLLIAAALAVASALSAALWQRRARLASLKIQGYATGQLWRAMLLESGIVLGAGCAVGAAAGVYGHALATRWLRLTTGFPAPFAVGLERVFLTLLLLGIIAIAVISLPGLIAARAPARTSFQE